MHVKYFVSDRALFFMRKRTEVGPHMGVLNLELRFLFLAQSQIVDCLS